MVVLPTNIFASEQRITNMWEAAAFIFNIFYFKI